MINRIESDTLEFKSEIVSDICKEIIAFANTRGGELLIGVADDGTVTGLSDANDILLQIKNMHLYILIKKNGDLTFFLFTVMKVQKFIAEMRCSSLLKLNR